MTEASTTDPISALEKNKETPPQRVVSLLGAATETLFRLGLGHTLVGRSHECDYPPCILSTVPCISRPKLDVDNSDSRTIDEAVRELSASGQAVYQLDEAALQELQPVDLLIAQDHCHVCAITAQDVAYCRTHIPQLILKPATLSDCFENITAIANALQVPHRGARLLDTMHERLNRVTKLVQQQQEQLATSNTSIPRVALLEWCQPVMGCGYWLPELVTRVGGHPLHCPPPGGATPSISFDALLESQPDMVILALCGFDIGRSTKEVMLAWSANQLELLCRTSRVYVVDGNYLVNRSGPRVVESAEALAEAIWPELQGHFGHFGTNFLTSWSAAVEMVRQGVDTADTKVGTVVANELKIKENQNNLANNNANDNNDTSSLLASDACKTVTLQLEHLRSGNWEAAFALNSVANQARWCDATRFANVLQSHATFARLLREMATVVEPAIVRDKLAVVTVQLPTTTSSAATELVWTMVQEPSSSLTNPQERMWRTEKVGF